jgi:hypothetical protein
VGPVMFQSDAFMPGAFVTGGTAGGAQGPGLTGVQPSLMEAIAGYARAGATRASDYGGDPNRALMVLVGGTDPVANNIRNAVLRDPNTGTGLINVTKQANANNSSARFTTRGTAPLTGQSIIIAIGSLGSRLFKGEIQDVQDPPFGPLDANAQIANNDTHAVTCGDQSRIFNRNKVFEHFMAIAADQAVRTVLSKYCAGFSGRHIQINAPSIPEMSFAGEDPSACIQQMADYIGWQFRIDEFDDVWFNDGKQQWGSGLIAGRGYNYDALAFRRYVTQNRTRIFYRGRGGNTTADTAANATAFVVDAVADYVVGNQVMIVDFPTFITAINTGTKTVTVSPAVPFATVTGEKVATFSQIDDLTAQAAMASPRTAAADGVFSHYISDERKSVAQAAIDAQANFARFNGESTEGSYHTWAPAFPNTRIRIALPYRKIWGEFVIQNVSTTITLAPDRVESSVQFSDTLYLKFIDILRTQARKRKAR